MELALLVYVISLLHPISGVLFAVIMIMGFMALFSWMVYFDDAWDSRFWPTVFLGIWGFAVIVQVLLPSEKTAYLMVGAYATQKIAEAPKTKEIGAEVLKIIEGKIKFYAEQAEKEMLLKQLQQETEKK